MDLMEDPMLMDLAEAGDIRAQYDLGMSRYNQNEKSAIQWLGKAAEQGNVRAQYVLGSIYIEGEFVDQDLKKAFDLIDSCSMLGDPECTFILGMFYEKGYGVVKPNTDIAEWYQREAAVYGVQRAIVTCVRESRSASTKMEESNNSNDEPCFRNSLHDLE